MSDDERQQVGKAAMPDGTMIWYPGADDPETWTEIAAWYRDVFPRLFD